MSGPDPEPQVENPGAAILLMFGAVMCFTAIDTCAKFLVQTLPPLEVVFFRYLGHFLIVAAVFLPLQGRTLFATAHLPKQILRALFLLSSTVFNFLALQFLPLAVTSAIFFIIPLLVCALSVPFLGERVGPRRWAAIVVGLIGVMIVVRPGLGALHWAWVLSMAASLSAASYMIMTRKLAGLDSTETSQLYAGMIAVVALFPFALSVWQWPGTGLEIVLCSMIGFFGWLGHQMLTTAHRFAAASVLAPFSYTQIVWMTASGYVVFGNIPDRWVFIGAGIVIASGLYMWMRERQLGKTTTAAVPPPK